MLFYKIIFHINAIIKKLFLKLIYGNKIHFGKKVTFRKRFNVFIDKNARICIGDNCFFNNDCSLNAQQEIRIGNNTILGENVKIYDHNHVFKNKDKNIIEQGFKVDKIIIGNNCWIGSNVVILKGTTVGDNVVIGAGCVINMNIPNNTIVKINQNQIKIEDIKYKK